MTTDDQQDAPNTAPLDGGIRQQSGPSGSSIPCPASQMGLPNNCDGGVQWPDEETAVGIMKNPIGKTFVPDGIWNIEEGLKIEWAARQAYRALTKHKAGV